MRDLCNVVAYMVAATRPAKKTLPDGRNTHLIVENRDWWERKLSEYWRIVAMEENVTQPGEVEFILEPLVTPVRQT